MTATLQRSWPSSRSEICRRLDEPGEADSVVVAALAASGGRLRESAVMPPAIEGDDHPRAGCGQCDGADRHLHELSVAQR